jgi:polyisoprenoid-binding protein YceI
MNARGLSLVSIVVSLAVGLALCNASESKSDGSDTEKKGSQAKKTDSDSKEVEHTNFVVDKNHARIGFKVAHLVISKVHGSFGEFDATLHLHGNELAKASATIKVASIDTGNKDRDDHLRKADFFDAAKYPNITFHGKSTKKVDGKNIMVGDLTIRGKKKEIQLEYTLKGPVKDPFGGPARVGLEATATINRKDFGVEWNKALEAGGVVVGEEVKLVIDLEASQK